MTQRVCRGFSGRKPLQQTAYVGTIRRKRKPAHTGAGFLLTIAIVRLFCVWMLEADAGGEIAELDFVTAADDSWRVRGKQLIIEACAVAAA